MEHNPSAGRSHTASADFRENFRSSGFTLTFKTVTGFYGFFLLLSLALFIMIAAVYYVSVPTTIIIWYLIMLIVSYPITYHIYYQHVAEPLEWVTNKVHLQPYVKVGRDIRLYHNEDIITKLNEEITTLLDSLDLLEKQIGAIAKEDLKHPVHDITVEGTLGHTFQKMRETLLLSMTTLIDNLRTTLKYMDIHMEKLYMATHRTHTSLQKVDAQLQGMTAIPDAITEHIDDISGIKQKVTENNTDAFTRAVTASTVLRVVDQNNMRAAESLGMMKEQASQAEKTAEALAHLAEKTELLAVNAAVEAARAGQSKPQFTAVADEIRNLGTEYKDAASHLKALSLTMADAIQATSQKTDKNKELLQEMNTNISMSRDVLKAMPALMEDIDRTINKVSLIALQQASQQSGASVQLSRVYKDMEEAGTTLLSIKKGLLALDETIEQIKA